MTKQIEKLKGICEAATAGPWQIEPYENVFDVVNCAENGRDRYSVFEGSNEKNTLKHIATFNPQTVLKLLAVIELQQLALKGYKPLFDNQDIVRNTDNDHAYSEFTAMSARIISVLQKTEQALQKTNELMNEIEGE